MSRRIWSAYLLLGIILMIFVGFMSVHFGAININADGLYVPIYLMSGIVGSGSLLASFITFQMIRQVWQKRRFYNPFAFVFSATVPFVLWILMGLFVETFYLTDLRGLVTIGEDVSTNLLFALMYATITIGCYMLTKDNPEATDEQV